MQTTTLEELSLLHIKEMNKPIIVIDFIGSIFIVFMVYPVTIKTYMDIYVLCLDILYIFLSVVVLKKNSKGQILRSTPNTAPLICGACNTQPEGLSTMA